LVLLLVTLALACARSWRQASDSQARLYQVAGGAWLVPRSWSSPS